jgi:hypothetical protein
VTASFETLVGLSETLERSAFHGLTPWWSEHLSRYLGHPTARRLVARVGRGGVKSTTIVNEAVNQTLFGDWAVPPGERHYFAWVSQNKSEAGQRIRQIAARLQSLGVPFDQAGDEINLRDLQRGFRVFACTVGAVSGFRCYGFCADELAKWSSADDGANPAPEVVASLRAMTVTHPRAREYFISSPLGKLGLHYDLVEEGDTGEQVVCEAPTWIANPSITEEQTRKLETDRRVWAREYAAIPQDATAAAFAPELVDAAFKPREAFTPAKKVLILDPSSGGLSNRDRFTWGVASWCCDESGKWARHGDGSFIRGPHQYSRFELPDWQPRGQPYLALHEVGAFEGGFAGSLTGDEIADGLAEVCRRHGVKNAHSDQRDFLFLETALRRRSIFLHEHTWTSPSKARAVQLIRRWLQDGSLSLPPDAHQLRKELLGFEEQITPAGSLTFGARRGGRDDFVALLVTLAHAELDPSNHLQRSNLRPEHRYFLV